MSIKIKIETRHAETFGPASNVQVRRYFSLCFNAELSLDGDADTACATAADLLRSICRQHNGDYLRITIELNGQLVARWHGAVDATIGEHLGEFLEGRPSASNFHYTAQRITWYQEALATGEIKLAREEAAQDHERQAADYRAKNGEASEVAALFVVRAREFRRGKHDRSFQVEGYCSRLRAARPAEGIQLTRILALAAA